MMINSVLMLPGARQVCTRYSVVDHRQVEMQHYRGTIREQLLEVYMDQRYTLVFPLQNQRQQSPNFPFNESTSRRT